MTAYPKLNQTVNLVVAVVSDVINLQNQINIALAVDMLGMLLRDSLIFFSLSPIYQCISTTKSSFVLPGRQRRLKTISSHAYVKLRLFSPRLHVVLHRDVSMSISVSCELTALTTV